MSSGRDIVVILCIQSLEKLRNWKFATRCVGNAALIVMSTYHS